MRGLSLISQPKLYSTVSIEKGTQKLSQAIDKEIQFEKENYHKLEDIDTFLSESGFEFHEDDDSHSMILSKQVAGKLVQVEFEARQPMPDEDYNQGEQEQMGGEDEQEDGGSDNFCDFSVYVQNSPSSKSGMVIEATSMDTEISISNILVVQDFEEFKKTHKFERQMKYYPGPEFSTLDERIQTSMHQYLEGLGVNEHLASFVEVMSLDKDQRLYMQWLKNVKDFINE